MISCISCKYFGNDIVSGYPVGVCRRYPPVIPVGVGENWNPQRFPIVSSDDWCGEHEAACSHHLVRWVPRDGPAYGLYCAICNEYLKSETYAPTTLEIFSPDI